MDSTGPHNLDDLMSKFAGMELVDSNALDFALRRLAALKEELERLKLDRAELGVLEAARYVARLAAGLVEQDYGLSRELRGLSGGKKGLEKLEELLKSPNREQVLAWRDDTKHGISVLHVVAAAGNLEACKVLVNEHGMSIWIVDMLGRTPLHFAAMKQQLQVCEFFTAKAEEVGRSMKGSSAPLDMAGCTPAALSALSSDKPTGVKTEDFESTRLKVKRHLHAIGDASISPRKPQSTMKRRTSGLSAKQQYSAKGISRLTSMGSSAGSPDSDSSHSFSVRYGSHLMNGWTVKMEDVILTKERVLGRDLSIFAVFDGHGGVLCAERCKEMLESEAGDSIMSMLLISQNAEINSNLAESICAELESRLSRMPEFELQQREVQKAVGNEPAKYAYKCLNESGTTLLMALITPDSVLVAHVGDSRGSLVYKTNASEEKRLDRAITRDHKLTVADEAFVQNEIRRIEDAGGFILNGKRVAVERGEDGGAKASLGMTRSIGDFWCKTNRELPAEMQAVSPEPDVWVCATSRKDMPYFLVLASDGVWDVMTESEIGKFVRERYTAKTATINYDADEVLREIAQELCDWCLQRESQDNMAVIIVDLEATGGGATSSFAAMASMRKPNFSEDGPRSPPIM